MKTLFSLLIIFCFILITACQSIAVPRENQETVDLSPVVLSKTAEPARIVPQTPLPDSAGENKGVTMLTITPDPKAQTLIQIAKESLAKKLNINMEQIQLSKIEAVVWPDASLGCPQPDMLYAQILTPGYLIKLKYNSRDFEYHAGKSGSLTYCENPFPPVEGLPDNT